MVWVEGRSCMAVWKVWVVRVNMDNRLSGQMFQFPDRQNTSGIFSRVFVLSLDEA